MLVQDNKNVTEDKVPFIYHQHARMPGTRKKYQVVRREINYNRTCNIELLKSESGNTGTPSKSEGTRNEHNNRKGLKRSD